MLFSWSFLSLSISAACLSVWNNEWGRERDMKFFSLSVDIFFSSSPLFLFLLHSFEKKKIFSSQKREHRHSDQQSSRRRRRIASLSLSLFFYSSSTSLMLRKLSLFVSFLTKWWTMLSFCWYSSGRNRKRKPTSSSSRKTETERERKKDSAIGYIDEAIIRWMPAVWRQTNIETDRDAKTKRTRRRIIDQFARIFPRSSNRLSCAISSSRDPTWLRCLSFLNTSTHSIVPPDDTNVSDRCRRRRCFSLSLSAFSLLSSQRRTGANQKQHNYT